VLNPEIVGRIGLEHLLVGSAVSPNAFCEGNDIGVSAGTGAVVAGAVESSAISGTPFSAGNAVTCRATSSPPTSVTTPPRSTARWPIFSG
jgi:hypothetical protein